MGTINITYDILSYKKSIISVSTDDEIHKFYLTGWNDYFIFSHSFDGESNIMFTLPYKGLEDDYRLHNRLKFRNDFIIPLTRFLANLIEDELDKNIDSIDFNVVYPVVMRYLHELELTALPTFYINF